MTYFPKSLFYLTNLYLLGWDRMRSKRTPDPPEKSKPRISNDAGFYFCLSLIHFWDCTIFMADEIKADTSVMLLGTINVVVAFEATRE